MSKPQAIKANKQSKKRRAKNRMYKGKMRAIIREINSVQTKDEAIKLLPKVYSNVDKLAIKGIIHKNTAARYKSRLTKLANKLT